MFDISVSTEDVSEVSINSNSIASLVVTKNNTNKKRTDNMSNS